MTASRLAPLLEQFDFGCARLAARMAGPVMDGGDGSDTEVGAMTDEEYLWEPVPDCWSVRRRADGPGPRATVLAGSADGDWGRDAAPYPHPSPPPFTTVAWRLSHLSEMLFLRADHTAGGHALTRDDHVVNGDVASGVAAFDAGVTAWRKALLSVDEAALDTVGRCTYPHGSDPEEPFVDIVWWVNQEVLHHGAEIALLRDLYRARRP
ncbi:DinB family protein [Streptomyces sp. NBC_00847]|uniref:DinB family protein n=1 Tax=Streptomyces sp. NBC_00847 TaxID=2975850 RepID=UPI00225B7904|nr:DinB family protein [Streptomyces sp. NBC_00847]MCX4878936.1 DinB family protein [Streptomyces sp. NBC_00847]